MTSDRQDQISDIYHRALERPAEDRRAFVKEACGGDEALREEVESLLQYELAAESFLETPAAQAAAGTAAARLSVLNRQLGPYTIVAPLGAGGMGDVYRARDSKLGRDVAIKILPSHLTADSERRSRFAREARVLATLNHPNIGAIYGLEESSGVTALVLELVEGPTLADRLERGPLPLSEALVIARQIAEALEAAHEKGIVHRDLKPGNIVLQSGASSSAVRAKVLDFGLAKLVHHRHAPEAERSVTLQSTEDGRILGTPAYMSPEQARGQPVDKRTDIWAFGCVLYEMLSGRRAFAGHTMSDTFVRILEHEPDWSALPARTPDTIRTLLRRCLQKDPQMRLRDIADARLETDEHHPVSTRVDPPGPVPRPFRAKAIAAGLALLALGSAALWWTLRKPESPVAPTSPTRLTFDPGLQTDPSFSPDGRSIVYASNQSGNFDIWMKPVSGGNPIQVTRDPAHDWQPDWSPDGSQIIFRSERGGGGLFLVAPTGGVEKQLTTFGYQPQWSPDGARVLFIGSKTPFAPVYTIGLDGREPRRVDSADLQAQINSGFTGIGWHPDCKRILFLAIAPAAVQLTVVEIDRRTIVRSRVDDRVQHRVRDLRLYHRERHPQPVSASPDGAALYFVAVSKELQSVWRLEIDPRTLAVTAGPHQVTVLTENTWKPRLSKDGRRLAFDARHGRTSIYSYSLDASGRVIGSTRVRHTPEGMSAGQPDLTADGTMLAFQGEYQGDSKHVHKLRVTSLLDGSERVLLSADVDRGEGRFPLRWSPDGTRLTYRYLGSMFSIRILDVRTGKEEQLTSPVVHSGRETPYGWSVDGRFVIVSSLSYNPGRATILLVPVSQAPKAEQGAMRITDSADFNLWNASMSPDAKWVCFQATTPGPKAASRDRGFVVWSQVSKLAVVSSRGGQWIEITDGTSWDDKPRWSADGRLLYFFSDRGGLVNVWGIAFDSTKGKPVGDAFPVTTFTGVGEQAPSTIESLELGVGGGRLAIPVINPTGEVWMLDHVNR